MQVVVARHKNEHPYVYATSRDCVVFRIETLRGSLKECTLIHWARTNPELRNTVKMCCTQRDSQTDYYQCKIHFSKVARYQKYYFKLVHKSGKVYYVTPDQVSETVPTNRFYEYLYANQTEIVKVPEWAKGIVYYQIFPERFYNGDITNDPLETMPWGEPPTRENFLGGDLKGILDKLDYMKELGIQCLYLNPIFKGDFNHKYATTDYFNVDPQFGTNDELRDLITACHKNGIRVLLDGVFNHCGTQFRYFEDVLTNQEKSKYCNWFYIHKFPVEITHSCYECVGAYKWMPKLNTANIEVRNYFLEVMEYWIKEYKIDGWRLDVADEVDTSLWQEARLLLNEKYPDAILLGETWGYGRKLVSPEQLNSVMNYVFRDIVLDAFAYQTISVSQLDSQINYLLSQYCQEYNVALYNLLGSHDTKRFLTECNRDIKRMKLAIAFQFLFPGSPAIYYGDEIGIIGENDPDCRKAMIWEESEWNKELLNYYRQFIHLKNQEETLKSGMYFTNVCSDKENVFGFIRKGFEDNIYGIFNLSEETRTIAVPVLKSVQCKEIFGTQSWDVLEDKKRGYINEDILEYKGEIEIKLAPYSMKVIKQTYGGKKE